MIPLKMVDLENQYKRFQKEIDKAISQVLSTSHFINGEEVTEFANQLANYLNIQHVIPCGSGTDALQIALMALDLQPEDEVITVPFTFVAPVEVITLLHLRCKFVDVDWHTFNIDISQIETAITPRTKAIIPIHLFGQSCNMAPLLELAERHHLYIIEDNCQSIGTSYCFPNGKTQKTGTMGHIGCTSFFPSKNLGCYGDGGALFTQDEQLAQKIKTIANHGAPKRYHYQRIGINSRLDTLQAAILNIKLKHLEQFIAARQTAAKQYIERLQDLPFLNLPTTANYSTHSYHQFTLKLIDISREKVTSALQNKGIPYGIYYPSPLHLQEGYTHLHYQKGDFPMAEKLCSCVLSLPMHTELTEEQIDYISTTLHQL